MFLWLTGPTQIGKTTFTEWLKSNGHASRILLIGQQLRKKYGAGAIAKMTNCTAPEELEKEVREVVLEFVYNNRNEEGLFVIDGFPRSIEQMGDLGDFADVAEEHKHTICFLDIDKWRDMSKLPTDELRLLQARRKDEHGLFDSMISFTCQAIQTLPFEMKVVELSRAAPVEEWFHVINEKPSIGTSTNLSYLMKRHKELDALYVKRYGISASEIANRLISNEPVKLEYKYVAFLEDMFMRLKEETTEAYEEVHKKFWSDSEMDGRKLRTEMADILHFWFTIALCLGMEADDVGRIYLEKRKVNIGRVNHGKKKGDDDHVGCTKA